MTHLSFKSDCWKNNFNLIEVSVDFLPPACAPFCFLFSFVLLQLFSSQFDNLFLLLSFSFCYAFSLHVLPFTYVFCFFAFPLVQSNPFDVVCYKRSENTLECYISDKLYAVVIIKDEPLWIINNIVLGQIIIYDYKVSIIFYLINP